MSLSKQEISLSRNELLAIIVLLSGTKMNPVNIGLLNKCIKAIEKIDGPLLERKVVNINDYRAWRRAKKPT